MEADEDLNRLRRTVDVSVTTSPETALQIVDDTNPISIFDSDGSASASLHSFHTAVMMGSLDPFVASFETPMSTSIATLQDNSFPKEEKVLNISLPTSSNQSLESLLDAYERHQESTESAALARLESLQNVTLKAQRLVWQMAGDKKSRIEAVLERLEEERRQLEVQVHREQLKPRSDGENVFASENEKDDKLEHENEWSFSLPDEPYHWSRYPFLAPVAPYFIEASHEQNNESNSVFFQYPLHQKPLKRLSEHLYSSNITKLYGLATSLSISDHFYVGTSSGVVLVYTPYQQYQYRLKPPFTSSVQRILIHDNTTWIAVLYENHTIALYYTLDRVAQTDTPLDPLKWMAVEMDADSGLNWERKSIAFVSDSLDPLQVQCSLLVTSQCLNQSRVLLYRIKRRVMKLISLERVVLSESPCSNTSPDALAVACPLSSYPQHVLDSFSFIALFHQNQWMILSMRPTIQIIHVQPFVPNENQNENSGNQSTIQFLWHCQDSLSWYLICSHGCSIEWVKIILKEGQLNVQVLESIFIRVPAPIQVMHCFTANSVALYCTDQHFYFYSFPEWQCKSHLSSSSLLCQSNSDHSLQSYTNSVASNLQGYLFTLHWHGIEMITLCTLKEAVQRIVSRNETGMILSLLNQFIAWKQGQDSDWIKSTSWNEQEAIMKRLLKGLVQGNQSHQEKVCSLVLYTSLVMDLRAYCYETLFPLMDESIRLHVLQTWLMKQSDTFTFQLNPSLVEDLLCSVSHDPAVFEQVLLVLDPSQLDLNYCVRYCLEHELALSYAYLMMVLLKDSKSAVKQVFEWCESKPEKYLGVLLTLLYQVLRGYQFPRGIKRLERDSFQLCVDLWHWLFQVSNSISSTESISFLKQLFIWDPEQFSQILKSAVDTIDQSLVPMTSTRKVRFEQEFLTRQHLVESLIILLKTFSSSQYQPVLYVIQTLAWLSQSVHVTLTNEQCIYLIEKCLGIKSYWLPQPEKVSLFNESLCQWYERSHSTADQQMTLLEESLKEPICYALAQCIYASLGMWDRQLDCYLLEQSSEIFVFLERLFERELSIDDRLSLLAKIRLIIPQLLQLDALRTAAWVHSYAPEEALTLLVSLHAHPFLQYTFLKVYLDQESWHLSDPLSPEITSLVVRLMARYEKRQVRRFLVWHESRVPWSELLECCESEKVPDAVAWLWMRRNQWDKALLAMEEYQNDNENENNANENNILQLQNDDNFNSFYISLLKQAQPFVENHLQKLSTSRLISFVPLFPLWFNRLDEQLDLFQQSFASYRIHSFMQSSISKIVQEEYFDKVYNQCVSSKRGHLALNTNQHCEACQMPFHIMEEEDALIYYTQCGHCYHATCLLEDDVYMMGNDAFNRDSIECFWCQTGKRKSVYKSKRERLGKSSISEEGNEMTQDLTHESNKIVHPIARNVQWSQWQKMESLWDSYDVLKRKLLAEIQ